MSVEWQFFLGSIVLGILLIMLSPRTPLVIIGLLSIEFILLFLLIWFGKIIPKILTYRIIALTFSIGILSALGWYLWPPPLLFVSPSSIIVNSGMDEEFVMKVTNNYDYPLYKVQVKIMLLSGDLSSKDISIGTDNTDSKIPPGRVAVTSIDIMEKGKPEIKIFFVEDINSHSTKSYPILIHTANMKLKSNLLFGIRGSCKNRGTTYSKSMPQGNESIFVIPPEGHHENCD